jgi:hypothetical protein
MRRLLQAPNLALATLWADMLQRDAGIAATVQRAYASGIAGEIPPDQSLPEIWVQDDRQHTRPLACSRVAARAASPLDLPALPRAVDGPFEQCWNCGQMRARHEAHPAPDRLLMTLPPLLWAGNAVVGRLMSGQVPPLTLNLLRWLMAPLILLPLAWRALRRWRRSASAGATCCPAGCAGGGPFNSLQYLALNTSSPLNVTLVASSMPVWMLAVGTLFYGERPRRHCWVRRWAWRRGGGARAGLAGHAAPGALRAGRPV